MAGKIVNGASQIPNEWAQARMIIQRQFERVQKQVKGSRDQAPAAEAGALIVGQAAVDEWELLSKDTNATRYLTNRGPDNQPAWGKVNLSDGIEGDLDPANIDGGPSTATEVLTGAGWAEPASGGATDIRDKLWCAWVPNNNAQLLGLGISTPTANGTITVQTLSDTTYFRARTGAVIGNGAGWRDGFGLIRGDIDFDTTFVIKTGAAVTDQRLWLGIAGTAPPADNDTAPSNDAILFRYSTVAADAGWVPFTRTAGAFTAGAAIGTVAADTRYVLRIRRVGGSVFFSVDGGAEQTISTTVPAITTAINWECQIYTRAAATKEFLLSRAYIEYGS
jgi:hypothetical protein